MAKKYNCDSKITSFNGNVRDKRRLYRALEGADYLVNATAPKIVRTPEHNSFECLKTKINWAMNLLDASVEQGAMKAVVLTTDKAISPIDLYGATMLASSKLFLASNSSYTTGHDTRFFGVRYDNVMGSRESFHLIMEKGKNY